MARQPMSQAPSGAPSARKGSARHEVRIVGGLWRRSLLPVADKPGLRPTPDRVRETLFNWLGQDLSGWRVVDAFAGSGALGFEAASRGAAAVLLLEQDPELVRLLNASRDRLKATNLQVQRTDAMGWLKGAAPASAELVLLDPPFDAGWTAAALKAASRVVVPGGYVYVEAGQPLTEWPSDLSLHRQGKAGAVHYHLLQASSASSLEERTS
jgi:16S rRNA (guanine966-N2)-methyltransferase